MYHWFNVLLKKYIAVDRTICIGLSLPYLVIKANISRGCSQQSPPQRRRWGKKCKNADTVQEILKHTKISITIYQHKSEVSISVSDLKLIETVRCIDWPEAVIGKAWKGILRLGRYVERHKKRLGGVLNWGGWRWGECELIESRHWLAAILLNCFPGNWLSWKLMANKFS